VLVSVDCGAQLGGTLDMKPGPEMFGWTMPLAFITV
jgi:hypothetical protein